MSIRSQLQPWHICAIALLAGAAILSILHESPGEGGGGPVSPLGPGAGQASGLGPANIPLPSGGWKAIGVVVWVPPKTMSNQPRGTVLKRPWDFHRVCRDGDCKFMFSRWTLYGPSATWLVQHGRFFTARFPPVRVPCTYPQGSSYTRHPYGQSHDYYKLRWSSNRTRIGAIERRIQTGCYRRTDPPDITRWRATRANWRSATGGGLS